MILLALELLGPPRLARTGSPLDLRVRKELALLAYLAVDQAHRHSGDTLLGLFWPDVPDQAARNNLRRLLGEAGALSCSPTTSTYSSCPQATTR
jgi:DNA-binding SARP family transcriptional activator